MNVMRAVPDGAARNRQGGKMRAEAILETAIYARDLDAAEAFYRDVFGLETVTKVPGTFVFLRCGRAMLLIFDPDRSAAPQPGNPIPRHGAIGPGHFCFRARDRAEIDAWEAHLATLGVAIELRHVWPGGGVSLYLRDPAGNSVELAEAAIWGLAP